MAGSECDREIPGEVEIRVEPRQPVTDPTMGITVPRSVAAEASHRLVTIGDSLTHGFMSGAIFRTDLSWPAIVAYELGLQSNEFRFPTYEWPSGPGGLPLDLERLARVFESRFGDRLDFWEIVRAALWVRSYMDDIEDYWERGRGSEPPPTGEPFHNMAVYGWDVLDSVLLTADTVEQRINDESDDLFAQVVENNGDRAGWVVLQRARSSDRAQTVLEAAANLGETPGGIETLIVALGSNNALGSVVGLNPCWTPDNYLSLTPDERLKAKSGFNTWRPSHFAADWSLLVERLLAINAQHVIVATVPSVTIAPIARGVGGKVTPQSRYFPHYTRPWISDDDFDESRDPNICEHEARAIDSAIDAYNESIIASVKAARAAGHDWLLFDMGGLLDRLATKRYIDSPWTRPAWWTPYDLPQVLRNLDPVPNTRFFRSGATGRVDGGLFSLDGVHPTTIGYGLIAQEVIRIMQDAGVAFTRRDGQPRVGTIDVDFERLVHADTLIGAPPASITHTLALLGWLDERLDWVNRILPFTPSPL